MSKTALVAGATGLIGRLLLGRLLDAPDYATVKVLSRRPLEVSHPKLRVLISELSGLDARGAELAADDVYCCLGTTLAKAGSRAAFEKVDLHMVVDLARAARKAGARQFVVISAAGTSSSSPSFYSRVKARMEEAVAAVGFEAVHILRPSLLLGAREESRPAERIGQIVAPLFSPLLRGPLARYRVVRGEDVAEAMIRLARRDAAGVHVHHLPLD